MRLRSLATAAATGASLLLVPFAGTAGAVPTTSTVVAYVADTDANGLAELWTRPADGSGTPAKVFSTANKVWLPALSPDGTKIAYLEDRSSVAADTNFRLFVRNTDGTGVATKLFDASDVLSAPAWSPDGSALVFSVYNWDVDAFGTFTIPVTGGTPTLIPGTDSRLSDEPSFSPSGTHVALDALTSDWDYAGIDLVDRATGARARLAGTSGGSDPVWSPDGQHILFQKMLPGCGVGLYRIPSGGGTPVAIREVEGYFLGSHEYSRDGSQIFYGMSRWQPCNPGTRTGDVWVMNADGSAPANVTNTTSVVEVHTSVAGGTPPAADTTPPAAPAGLAATVAASSAKVTWTASGDAIDFAVVQQAHDGPAPTSPTDGTVVYRGPGRSATVAGLTAGTDYDYYLFAIDSSGNVSPVSERLVLRPTAAPVMAGIARVGGSTTGTSFTVRWTNTAATYEVQQGQKVKSASGTWSSAPVYGPADLTPHTSLPYTGAQARSHYFRVRASDGHGNFTAWSAPTVAHVPLNDTFGGFSWGSGWVAKSSTSRYLGTYRTTITPGAAMALRVETSRFVVIGDKCASCGAFKVYVDGVLKATVDTKSSTTQVRQVLYAGGTFTSIKARTIRVVAVGTSGRPRVSIDAIGLQR